VLAHLFRAVSHKALGVSLALPLLVGLVRLTGV
jgi:hypothetical protein